MQGRTTRLAGVIDSLERSETRHPGGGPRVVDLAIAGYCRRLACRTVEQEIRFCAASDGVRLAWAKHGKGPPIVKAANWLTHLEYDWESPVWRHWLEGLGERHTLIRYDERGCGLSDRETKELSLERWVADLETVVDAAGLDRFVLLGISQGAATAIGYAVRHPDRVDRVVLYGGYARDGADAVNRSASG